MNTLDFKSYMLASDSPENRGYLGSTSLRRTEDWYRLFEVASEMVEKYGLDGSGIPIGAKVLLANNCSVYRNTNRGYKGISDGGTGVFRGPVDDTRWYYFRVSQNNGDSWYYRPCWWRFLIVLPETA